MRNPYKGTTFVRIGTAAPDLGLSVSNSLEWALAAGNPPELFNVQVFHRVGSLLTAA
jgi:hypothetical protein